MSRRNIAWLYKELPLLVSKGLISEQAAAGIKQYYGEVSETQKKQLFVTIISVIGTLLIGLGIISLIAYNWESLGRSIRAVISILPLAMAIGFTGWVLLKAKGSDALRESAAVFHTLMIAASIALICQTYNISGDLRDFTLTWMLLAVPLVYIAEVSIPAVIYVIGITVWSIGYIFADTNRWLWYWPLVAVVIPHFIQVVRKAQYTVRAMLLAEMLGISVALVSVVMISKTVPSFWMGYYPVIFSVFYLIGRQKFSGIPVAWQRPLAGIGNLALMVLGLMLTNKELWSDSGGWFDSQVGSVHMAVSSTVFVVWLCGCFFLNYKAIREKRMHHVAAGLMPLVAFTGLAFKPAAAVLFNLYFLALSLVRIDEGMKSGRMAIVNQGLLMLAVLIAVRFFSSEFSLVLKGLVMIALGVGFLVTNLALIRRNKGVQHA